MDTQEETPLGFGDSLNVLLPLCSEWGTGRLKLDVNAFVCLSLYFLTGSLTEHSALGRRLHQQSGGRGGGTLVSSSLYLSYTGWGPYPMLSCNGWVFSCACCDFSLVPFWTHLLTFIFLSLWEPCTGDGSVTESTCCCRAPEFGSRHPSQVAHDTSCNYSGLKREELLCEEALKQCR